MADRVQIDRRWRMRATPDGNLPAPSPGFVHFARAAALADAARVSLCAAFPKEPRSGFGPVGVRPPKDPGRGSA